MKLTKKLLSVLLALVMVVSLLPMNVFAAEGDSGTVTVIAGSDFQDPRDEGVAAATYSSGNVKDILDQIKETHPTVDGLIFCGDYDKSMSTSGISTRLPDRIKALKNTVEGVYGSDLDEFFVQGNHDQVTQKTCGLTGPGNHDTGDYGVFIIDEDDYQWSSQVSESKIKTTAANLKSYLDAKADANYAKPIFVASHVPLHFSPRCQEGDGKYAKYIFDVLQNAGKAGLNIIFLYGHDHSQGWDNYMGGAAVYLPKGHNINISRLNDTTSYGKTSTSGKSYDTYQLNFTYMNAGFTGYYADWEPELDGTSSSYPVSGVDKTKTMTVFTITDDQVTVERYDADGVHVLKAEGKENVKHTTRTKCELMTDTLGSPQVIKLQSTQPQPESKTLTDDPTGISVTTVSGTTLNVKPVTVGDNHPAAKLGNVTAYEITLTGYASGENVEVKIPGSFASGTKVYYRNGDELTDMNAVAKDGYLVFTTNHFSEYDVVEPTADAPDDGLNWVEIPGGTTYSYTLVSNGATGIKSGEKYLIVSGSSGSSGSAHALTKSGGHQSVTIDNGTIADLSNTACVFTLTKSGDGYTIKDNGGTYLYPNATYKNGKNGGWSYSLRTQSSSTPAAISGNNGSVKISRGVSDKGHSTTSCISYNNAFGANNTGSNLYLFKETANTGASSYAALSGPLQYELTVGDTLSLTNKVWFKESENATPEEVNNYTFGTVDTTTAGTKTIPVSYLGKDLGTITVTVKPRTVTNISVAPMAGTVYTNASSSAKTGSKLTITYDKGEPDVIDVTLDMLSGNFDKTAAGTYENLTVTYGGRSVSGYTLNVLSRAGNDYPEYPNEGAVKVDKNGNGIDFTSTGVAKINLSTVGVPMNKGVDVIVMLDTSSSMTRDANNKDTTVKENQRIYMLKNSLTEMVNTFQTPNADGSLPDIRMAIGDFNGFTYLTGTSATDYIGQQNYDQKPTAQVYTGDKKLDAGAFVDVNGGSFDIAAINDALETTKGTNYDDAFDRIYRLGTAISEQNQANKEDRELYVIFMSDGATFQYNYFYSRNTQSIWANWLDGSINMNSTSVHGTHKYFKNGTDNSHRMANAVKGSPDDEFEVIRPDNTLGTPTGQNYMYKVPGLGATLYSIGFCITEDGSVPKAPIQKNIENLASVVDGEKLYYDAANQEALTAAFDSIANNIKQAATNAYFTDTMGDAYDLQLKPVSYKLNGTDKTITPTIEVTEYNAYKRSDIGKTIGGVTVTEDKVGQTYGTGTVKETVTFNAAGTEAYSSTNPGVNILTDGVICAKNFYYNTTSAEKTVDGITIAPESFYWKIGTIGEKVLNLSYYVYLTGSMEGQRAEGSYPTNKSATLYYDNWLGNKAHKDTVSPKLAWGGANVSYAFYLVDENTGKPVVNRTTGETGSFANRVAMTTPVEYASIKLNSTTTVDNMAVVASQVLPEGYTLYNDAASYTVTVSSSGSGSNWVINDTGKTTYVTGYNGSEYTNESRSDASVDYTHTTVWFAVKYEIKAIPDVVVIDYGLPVDISVLANDMFGENGTLNAVGAAADKPDDKASLPGSFVTKDLVLTHGTAAVNDKMVRYTPTDMQMDAPEKFAYAVNYVGGAAEDNGYYYSDVTVIPATTIYYEDSFVKFSDGWTTAGTTASGVQAEDRPGLGNLTDANNLYGYDQAYENCTTYSMGSAQRVTVKQGDTPTASFTFTGTGFDVISLTSNMTGTIFVEVSGGTNYHKIWAVDTYYGYTHTQDGYIKYTWTYGEDDDAWHISASEKVTNAGTNDEVPAKPKADDSFVIYEPNHIWTPAGSAANDLYQIPVVKSPELAYGTYTVTIYPEYNKYFDHTDAGSYDFYLDAIRIYNPAKNDDVAKAAYAKDNEAYPQYIELRNNLIDAKSFGTIDNTDGDSANGVVFIDGYGATGSISDYTAYGPNNEVYLAAGQAVAFTLENSNAAKIASVQLGVKAPNGSTGISIAAVGGASKTITANTATDLYYDISDIAVFKDGKTNVIVITNTTDKLVSLTNVKTTYKEDPAPAAKTMLRMSAPAARTAVQFVNTTYLASIPVEETVAEPQVFTPGKLTVSLSKTTAKVGDKVTVTVKTSGDVSAVTVNGENAKAGKTDRKTGDKTWTCTIKVTEAGTLAVSVVAYDASGVASNVVNAAVSVAANTTAPGKKNKKKAGH